MPPGFLRLTLAWVVLLLLLGVEFGLSFIHMPPSMRPVILVVVAPMAGIIAIFFMHVGRGPTVVRGFAVMAVFWIILLIGLGSMDPLTRLQFFASTMHAE